MVAVPIVQNTAIQARSRTWAIGPVSMDYACAIATVREAANELSRFVEDTYGEN